MKAEPVILHPTAENAPITPWWETDRRGRCLVTKGMFDQVPQVQWQVPGQGRRRLRLQAGNLSPEGP